MRKLFASLIAIVIAVAAYSQTSIIKGTVVDSFEKKNLVNTSIAVLRKSDSTLAKFTRADKDGNFQLTGLKAGSYIMMNTHPYLGDYFDNIELKAGETLELGKLYMTPKTKLLEAVIVKTGSPIRIKGDTTIYTADSFKVRPGANVEELLRRLPGISVDRTGQITAMGERVKKVLVDGEEFFGTDPGIATKSLRADAVQEVQVFDKKSDQAEFTGIDDGVRDKTINLKMKKLSGYFGKAELGGGLKDKYNNSAMLNIFRNKRKIAGYGIMSNTGQTNLDWKDAQNYGGSDNMSSGMSEDGGMYISFSGDDGGYWGGRNGIPESINGGLHFSDKFTKEKNSFNSGYKYSKVDAPGITNVFSKVFLPDSSWNKRSTSDNFSSNIKHAWNLTMEFNLDSNNSVKWTSRFNKNKTLSDNKYYEENTNDLSEFINNTTRRTTSNSDKNNASSSLLWRHKFKKPTRTLSVNADFNWSESRTNSLLYSLNNFYKNGTLDDRDTTDQMNYINSVNNSISSKISYTEPLIKDVYLELSYGFSYNNSKSDRITNEKSFNGKYEEEIDSLSNRFVFNRMANTPGINFRLNKKKHGLTLGTGVAFTDFEQKNITNNTITNYSFVNFLPRANYQFKIKPNESIRIGYSGSNSAPTPEQLQPTRVNTDPLNQYIGNPGLDQSFRHNFNLGYNFYNVLKEKGLWTGANFGFTQNAFVNSSVFYDGGKRTYQTVNANGQYNLNLNAEYSFTIKKLRMGFGPYANISRNIDFVNNVKNISTREGYGFSFNVNQYIPEKINFWVGPRFSYNINNGTVNTSANAKYWALSGDANFTVTLKKPRIDIGSNVSAQFRQKDPRFPANNNYTIWNANISKRFLKEDKLEIKFSLNDILDQNRGYQRNFDSYSFTETYYQTLRRFWLVSAVWNLSKNGKPAKGFF
jgi:outer membrane receptor protein involved in Fe transport